MKAYTYRNNNIARQPPRRTFLRSTFEKPSRHQQMMALLYSNAQEHSSLRKMRKGTRSCIECRQRKVRCITIADSQACKGCTTRNLCCTDQKYGIPKSEMAKRKSREQLRQVELQGLISQLLQKLHPNAGQAGGSRLERGAVVALTKFQQELTAMCPSQMALSSDNLSDTQTFFLEEDIWPPHAAFEKMPLLSLFGHGAKKQSRSNRLELDTTPCSNTDENALHRRRHIALELKSFVPQSHDLTALIAAGQAVWRVWAKAFPEMGVVEGDDIGECDIQRLQSHVLSVLNSGSAIVIAKVLLCCALSLQQTKPHTDINTASPYHPVDPDKILRRYLSPVEAFLSQNEGIACSITGLQCMLIQSRIYVNQGAPYKAWFTFRRLVSYAQILGLHRQPSCSTEATSHQKRALWTHIWHGERYLSLILGLPSCATDSFAEHYKETSKPKNGEALLYELGVVAGKVIDRDQNPNQPDFLTTLKLDQELDICKNLAPETWWDLAPAQQPSLAVTADILSIKFAYHNIKKLIHLPFIFQAAVDSKYQFSRMAALEASREMIKCYQIMRDVNQPMFTICILADFQVFTAAMVLTLNLFTHSRCSGSQVSGQTDRDWELVVRIIEILERISKSNPSGAATQAAKILQDLYQLRCKHHDEYRTYQAIIPYFGKFCIRMGYPDDAASSTADLQTISRGVQWPSPHQCNEDTDSSDHLNSQTVTFDSYFPMPQDNIPWQDLSVEWNPWTDFNLSDDWTSFVNTEECL